MKKKHKKKPEKTPEKKPQKIEVKPSSLRLRIGDWTLFFSATLLIYATLPLVRRIQFAVSEAGGDDLMAKAPIVIIFCCLLAGLVWLFFIKKDRRPLTLFALANVGIAYYLVLYSLADIPIERMHLIEYGFLAFLAFRCTRHYFESKIAYGVAMLMVFDAGFIDEVIQYYLPTRVYDTRDVVTNALAGFLGLLAVMAARRKMP